jgi:hypothetical protein
MVNYTCPTCFKEFDRKSSFLNHTENKKKPCQPHQSSKSILIQNNPKNSVFFEAENDGNLEKICCNYCNKEFFNNANLNKHLRNNSCKVKKELDDEKEKMFKLLLEQKNDEIKEHKVIISKLESMIKQQNDKITDLIKKIKPSSITNNTMNNIVIKTNMNKFGEENLEKLLNKKHFEDNILMLTGSNAFQACAEMIYNNPKHPENQTVFCTDLSREKFMVFNGEDWTLHTRTQVFTEVQNKIQEYIDMHEEELQDKLNRDMKFKERFFNRIGKFYKKYYGNKHEKDPVFENKTDEQLMRFFYSIKEFVKNNYNLMYNQALETERKKMLELENNNQEDVQVIDIPKKRGRPKK